MSENLDYVNSLIIKEHTFDNGGSILKCSAKVEDLKKELDNMQKKGWANFNIVQRRSPSEKGVTHYAKVDKYEPTGDSQVVSQDVTPPAEDDLPF